MSTTSTLEFFNLPTDTIGKIIEKCDLKEQLTLRKVSKDLRSLVDEQKPAYKSITIDLTESCISCVYNGKNVVYGSKKDDVRFVRGAAVNDLSIALNNPKLRLDELTVSYANELEDVKNRINVVGFLNSLNHQIHVKTLRVYAELLDDEYLLPFLRCLKPKELVKIVVFGGDDCDDSIPEQAKENVRKIASLDQWKQAEQLTARYCFDYFPSEILMHFKRFVIFRSFLDTDFFMILKNLFITSTNFESCTIKSNRSIFCSLYLGSFCEKVDTEDADFVLYHHKIPGDSNKILEFKFDCHRKKIIISKKNL